MKVTPLSRTCPTWTCILAVLLFGSACDKQTPTKPSSMTTTPVTTTSAQCSVTLQLSQSTVDLKAVQQIRLTVTAPATCQWTVTTPPWVSVVSQYSGTGTYVGSVGTGTVTLWLQIASSTVARDADIYVGTSSVHLYQQPECSFTLQPLTFRFDEAGGRASADLSSTLPTCGWSLDTPAWIRVQPTSGTGSAAIAIDVSPSNTARTGLISTGGYAWGVSQTPTGAAQQFAFIRLQCGSIRPGESKVSLCWFFLQPATSPTSSNVKLIADMGAVGGGIWTLFPDMGTDGLGFSPDVMVPADLSPGLKPIPLTAHDAQGRTAMATATIPVLSPR